MNLCIPTPLKTTVLAVSLGLLPFDQPHHLEEKSFLPTANATSVLVDGNAAAVNTVKENVEPTVTANIPTAQRWQTHIQQDLLPFWTHPDALGDPIGNFPSVRCDDGTLINLENPCPEVQDREWLMAGDQYVVALSRQIYTYGVAFQLTGDLQYLDYAKAGVDYLRQNALDRENGGVFSWWDAKEQIWGPELSDRNPQEQAYALMGLAYYYYLTHDVDVLQDILELKDFIFETYYNPELGLLQWQLQDGDIDRALDKRLVAQLDQLNAYMLLLTPILPGSERTEWTRDMVWLSEIMVDNFYSTEENLFFLSAVEPDSQNDLATDIDFGHTIKTMWLMRMIGMLSNEPALVDFAVNNAPKVLERAFIPELGAWAEAVNPDGTVNRNASWWVYAELNQFTASFALQEPAMTTYLSQTYDYWFDHFVDPQFGEVWTGVDALTQEPIETLPKQWPWKNGYHSLEHALVGYITSGQLHNEPVMLHYAFERLPDLDTIHPYYYRGDIEKITLMPNEGGQTVYTVTFSDIH